MMEAILALQSQLEVLAAHLGCSWTLLAGQALRESSGDPLRIGDDGKAFGLWQIHAATLENVRDAMPDIATYALADLADPVKSFNVFMAETLRLHFWLKRDYGQAPVWCLLAAWNWGCGNVQKLLNAHTDGETNFTGAYLALPDVVRNYIRECYELGGEFDESGGETNDEIY
jgi:hypothetical protein